MIRAQEILDEMRPLGSEAYKKVMLKHGVREPLFGVKIEHLKKIQKRIKKDYQLALDLYDTGVYDARYLAGLIADDARMTKRDLQHWLESADCSSLREYTVPWVAAESAHGHELALKWIESKDEGWASAGWATLSNLVALTDDSKLDIPGLKKLLDRVSQNIQQQPDRVRYTMNGFVIAVGSYVKGLSDYAVQTAENIGAVSVSMGETECKVPSAVDYINKVRLRGSVGKKRKTVKC
jgi:3-methyladenine DNA glycosylase AlkD